MKTKFLFLFIVLSMLLSCNQDKDIQPFNLKGRTMGTYYSVKVLSANQIDQKKLIKEIDAKLRSFNLVFSTYKKDSELSKLNRLAKNVEIKISDDLAHVLRRSKSIYQKSHQAFDITVGPLVNSWGFGPDGKRKKPSLKLIKKLKKQIGSNLFTISDDGIFMKEIDGLYLDLSAIAKGFGVDVIYELLNDKKLESFLVEIGGEVRSKGHKVGNAPWVVGIEKPTLQLGSSIHKAVPISNKAMATSGSYRNFVKYGDAVFSHTIDPITGQPVKHKLVSVSVILDNCADSDAWATAFMALGPEKGAKIAEELNIPVLFLLKTKDGFEEKLSKKFAIYLAEAKKKRLKKKK